jgi:hypothetical protein
VRVGLSSRVPEPAYFGRGTLTAVSDRGLLERRLAIPVRAPSGLERIGVDWLGPASGISGVRLGSAFRDGVETGIREDREVEFVKRGVEVGSRRYRARLHKVCSIHVGTPVEVTTHATAFKAILVLYDCSHFSSALATAGNDE